MAATSQSSHVTAKLDSDQMLAQVLVNRMILDALNSCFTAAGCATATTTSKAKTVNTATYTIDGIFKTKAATDNLWTPTGGTVPVASFTKYLLLLDTAGAATVLQSSVSQVSAAACTYPNMPDATSCIGVLTVATDATHTFIPGTTLLGAAGITSTFTDGTDKFLLPLIADASSGAELLVASVGSTSAIAGIYA